MTAIEPKLAERRKGVQEDRARGRLKGVLITIGIVLVVVGAVWLVRSPLLSIKSVDVQGAQQSDPLAAVASLGMGVGTPTMDVARDAIEAAILEDPWVASVEVRRSWPGGLAIDVTEHVPMASVRSGDGWVQVALDGSVVPGDGPVVDAARIMIDTGPVRPGYEIVNPLILGAIEFADALRDDLEAGVSIAEEDGGLVATVDGYRVILGRPTELEDKAVVVATLLDTGLTPGAVINVVAPLRPAVSNPQPEVEAEE